MRSKLKARKAARAWASSVRMPTLPVRAIVSRTAVMNAFSWPERRVPTVPATSSGRSAGVTIPALTASSKSWHT